MNAGIFNEFLWSEIKGLATVKSAALAAKRSKYLCM